MLPARFPNLLVNGAGGIAVGMATNIPPHNLGEVIDAAIRLVDEPGTPLLDLIELLPGPDFPTGGIILGKEGIQQAYATGRGSIIVRARTEVEPVGKDREAIIVTEVPYQVNKARMIERIAEVARDKRVEGISDLRDESDRQGLRVVIELKRDADPDVVLNQLFKFTPLQTSFGINMVALNGGRPETMNLKEVLQAFLAFREEVILRRTAYDLARARERAHVLLGLAVAVANIDEVIALIRRSPDTASAREALCQRDWPIHDLAPLIALAEEREVAEIEGAATGGTYRLSPRQAQAILDLRLQRLTAMERDKIRAELEEIGARIKELLHILRSRDRLLEVLKDEMLEVRTRFGDDRRTEISGESFGEIDIEELIQREDMVVTVTHGGYIKRVPLITYRAQKRGGRGRSGMAMHEDDFVSRLFVASTHTPVLFFSSRGMVYKLKVYKLPLGTPQARGRAMRNLFPSMVEGEYITTVLPLPEDEESWQDLNVMFATAKGKVRRNDLSDFTFVPANGKIAMKLDADERLIGVVVCDDTQDVLLAARGGKAIRFRVDNVRVFRSRTSEGVRGIDLAADDEVISISVLDHVAANAEEREEYLRVAASQRRENGEGGAAQPTYGVQKHEEFAHAEQMILTITRNGYGKRSSAFEYRVTNRGGSGIINILTSARNGDVAASFPVGDGDQIMLVTDKGKMIRIPVGDIRIAGRSTQGVTLFNTDPGEHVVSAAHVPEAEGDTAAVEADDERPG